MENIIDDFYFENENLLPTNTIENYQAQFLDNNNQLLNENYEPQFQHDENYQTYQENNENYQENEENYQALQDNENTVIRKNGKKRVRRTKVQIEADNLKHRCDTRRISKNMKRVKGVVTFSSNNQRNDSLEKDFVPSSHSEPFDNTIENNAMSPPKPKKKSKKQIVENHNNDNNTTSENENLLLNAYEQKVKEVTNLQLRMHSVVINKNNGELKPIQSNDDTAVNEIYDKEHMDAATLWSNSLCLASLHNSKI